ncbi:hypothetical protein [Roseisolibacter agri]|uniref:Uncharacterized protein n=1 Tax=Roseisolibacter agri TaxID=2014610 RepID=A0AA37QGL8_9BACT|nr:hypothetical protein [Roseisolibacter agri]GLC25433.1 hypothetical protein rosag_19460 [Roseisolibacter agri]
MTTSTFKIPLAEFIDHSRVRLYREQGVPESDIALSTASGMDARDVRRLRETTAARSLLIIVRCPKPEGRALQGELPPKPVTVHHKSKDFGLVEAKDRRPGDPSVYLSDYDLMGLWRYEGSRYRPLPLKNFPGAFDRTTSFEAWTIVKRLNQQLKAPFQHGCQDDLGSTWMHPGVSARDHFALFDRGRALHVDAFTDLARWYRQRGMAWHYLPSGRHPWPPLPERADGRG